MRANAFKRADFQRRFVVALLIVAASSAMVQGVSARESVLESAWRNASGSGDENRPASISLDNGRVSVAASNDDRFLYVTLTTKDRNLYYSMFRNGMTLWIDPKGGRHETVGLRYPIGLEGDPVSERRVPSGGGSLRPASSVPPDQWFELVGAGDDYPRRVALGDIPGLDVRLNESDEAFLYEAKLPLVASADRALVVGAAMGGTIGVGWKIDRPKSETIPPSGGMGGGARHGMGGGSHGGRGSGASREDRSVSAAEGGSSTKPLHVWVKVRLATGTLAVGASSGN